MEELKMIDRIVAGFRDLSTAAVADVFRHMGYPQQVMSPTILPIMSAWKLCGRAFTQANLPSRPKDVSVFQEAEAQWGPGHVIVESYWGAWGINFAVGASKSGCAGAVIDGSYRDIPGHCQELPDFPVFCRRGLPDRSANPGGSHVAFHTRWMYAYNVPINCGGVRVEPGDVVLGDDDGVVVVPKGIEEVVLGFAQSYDVADSAVAEAKREGKSLEEAYAFTARWRRECGLLEWLAEHGVPGSPTLV
jgi:regulator of RNase E activity RraA